ncbi:MAG: class I SAM-dependent methyltransferase, partial [bacterium]|nr:class I SAM-dependent methyltransferase [bacterium]
MDLKSTYNYIAEDWTKDHENNTWWIAGTDKFASYLKQGESVLDVGCASGMKSGYLTKKGFVVTGVDFSDKMIELAQKRMPSRFFFVRDINEPLNLKSKFDGIFAQAVLLHIPKNNIKKALGNLLELLKPNGYIYI